MAFGFWLSLPFRRLFAILARGIYEGSLKLKVWGSSLWLCMGWFLVVVDDEWLWQLCVVGYFKDHGLLRWAAAARCKLSGVAV